MKKVLFITKNFPPQKWWMEQYSYDLYTYLKKYTKIYLIANTKGRYFLPIFGLIWLIQGFCIAPKVDIIYIWDWSISWLGYILGKIFTKKIYVTIHWLDITWSNKLYQAIIPNIIKKYDGIVCVSTYTKEICLQKWINPNKLFTIHNGLNFDFLPKVNIKNKQDILKQYWVEDYQWRKILFSIWRFVERKWIHDFLEHTFTKLEQEKYMYIIAWFWKYKKVYEAIIKKYKLNNVYIIWKIPKQDTTNFMSISDIFVMPNIKVPDDVEGFWIVVIEAGYYWLPVIATKLEWIQDAIIDWKTWIFIDNDQKRNQNFEHAIKHIDQKWFKKDIIKDEVIKRFSWDIIIQKYLELIK